MRKIGRDELRNLLEDALGQAMQGANDDPDNKTRSAIFVECLTKKFRDYYSNAEFEVRVSSKGNPREFLTQHFDQSSGSYPWTGSPSRNRQNC